MGWIAIRMLTGDRIKFIGLLFGVAFSTLLINQQLTIFVNLLMRGASAANEITTIDIWVMDPVGRTTDVTVPLASTNLERVRGVEGVAWAVPLIRSSATVRTPEGDLEGVQVIGVDDATLIGLPRNVLIGERDDLFNPDTVFIDDVGSRRMFKSTEHALGTRLELNDQRAIISGIVDVNPTFTSTVVLYTRYSNALNYVPGTRNRMSFVLVKADVGISPETLTDRIQNSTGLKARTRQQFANDGVDFIIENTGIPINFGITVVLGFVVGVAIVGLTFNLFIRDNIKQFGALKAIGVTNKKIRDMVATQAALVGFVGYAQGTLLSILFVWGAAAGFDTLKGFYTPWQIPLITAVVVMLMIFVTGRLGLRSVLKMEPAEVFR